MYAAFLVRPGALGSPQRRKMSETSVKSFHEMKGDRDGKSEKGVQQDTAYSAVVVNGYPRPYIEKGHRSKRVIAT